MSSPAPPAKIFWSPATALALPVVLVACLFLLDLAVELGARPWLSIPLFAVVVLLFWGWSMSAFTFWTRLGEKGMTTGGWTAVSRVRWLDVTGARVMPDGKILVALKNGGGLTVRTYQRSGATAFLGNDAAERLAERITAEVDATAEYRVWEDDGLVELRRSRWLSPALLILVTLGFLWLGTLWASWLYW
ncbi:hypothetical protein [Nocardiopsis ganjiahuensis]|uniref:hypothetical protein n=1 Tax=Nocardiopsis ganjiahuensis TaxID=239984 RepID=UPI00034B6B8B|nr:hypothetical protein [Nocardiopsis ganjiahuensis]